MVFVLRKSHKLYLFCIYNWKVFRLPPHYTLDELYNLLAGEKKIDFGVRDFMKNLKIIFHSLVYYTSVFKFDYDCHEIIGSLKHMGRFKLSRKRVQC